MHMGTGRNRATTTQGHGTENLGIFAREYLQAAVRNQGLGFSGVATTVLDGLDARVTAEFTQGGALNVTPVR